MRRGILTGLITLAVSLCAATASVRKDLRDPVFKQIESITQSLSTITGLPEKHSIPYGRMSKRQLHQFLTKRIRKTVKPAEIYADELALKMFGLVPQDFDLKASTIDLLTEQAAAFYDYDAKRLFLLEGSSVTEERTTLAHELAHGIADQYFDLNRFMEQAPENDDENLAHTAVVEGQASWLMIAYELKENGKEPVPTPEMLKAVADSSESGFADYPILNESPLYIQQSLLFPYREGLLFFQVVYKRLGKDAFKKVFTEPPADSAQIIHPERYFAHERPSPPVLPSIHLSGKMSTLTEGSVGEFDHRILLQQYASSTEADLAQHLRGAKFEIYSGKGKKSVLSYGSQWDSDESAMRFFGDYQEVLQKKWKQYKLSTRTVKQIAGTGDNGYFITRVRGKVVTSVEGLSDIEPWQELQDER